MGQLDSIEINELFFMGLVVSTAPAYFAEELDSVVESVKVYIYTAGSIIE